MFFQWICSYFVWSNFVTFPTFIFIAFQCKLFSLLSLLTKRLGVYITILAIFYIWYDIFLNFTSGELLMFSLKSVPWLVFILLHFSMTYYILNDFMLFHPLTSYFTLLYLWNSVQNNFIHFTDMDKEKLQSSILIFFYSESPLSLSTYSYIIISYVLSCYILILITSIHSMSLLIDSDWSQRILSSISHWVNTNNYDLNDSLLKIK